MPSVIQPVQPVDQILNEDIYGLLRRMRNYIKEIMLCSSANTPMTNAHDIARAQSYIESIRGFLAHVKAQPLLDAPETSPNTIEIPVLPAYEPIENDSLYDLARILMNAYLELVHSASARMGNGIIKHDDERLRAFLDKAQNLITQYILVVDPIDMPETVPSAPVAPPGNRGI
jgi:hypothetical protein